MRLKAYPCGRFALALLLLVILPSAGLGFTFDYPGWSPFAAGALGSGPGPGSPSLHQDLDIPSDPQLDQAVKLANTGKLHQALSDVKRVLKQNPKSTAAMELQGAILALQGQLGEGLKTLQEAVRMNPRQYTALTKIGDIYLAEGKTREAEVQFLKALQANPDYARANQRIGLILEKEGKLPEAIAHFEKGLVGTPPDYVGTKINLARLYNLTHQFDKTINLLAHRIPSGERGFLLHIFLAAAYLGQKQSGPAQTEFGQALKLAQPDAARAYLALGIAYRQAGLNQESRQALNKAIQLQPKGAMAHWELGDTLMSLQEPDTAIEQFRQAIKLDPQNRVLKQRLASFLIEHKKFPEALALSQQLLHDPAAAPQDFDTLGSAYQVAGQFDQAQKIFLERLKKFPQDPMSYYQLGLFYGFIKKYDQAVAQLNKGLAIAPDNLPLLRGLTLAYQRQGDLKQAIKTNKKIVDLDPENLASKLNLAALYKESGDVSAAVKTYQDILAHHPEEIVSLNNLAQILASGGNLSDARQLAEKASTLAPDNGHVLDTLGWIRQKQNEPQKALSVLNKAASLLPGDPDVLYHYAVVLDQLGRQLEARQYLETALGISRNFPGANQAEKLLQKLPPANKK